MEGTLTSPAKTGAWRSPLPISSETRSAYPYQPQRYKTYGSDRDERLAKGLGWFSVGLGAVLLLAPRAIAKTAGISQDRTGLMRAVGMREIASGVGILSQREPAPWLWTRVAGDAMDLTLLGFAAAKPGVSKNRMAAVGMAVAGVTVLDVLTSMRNTRGNGMGQSAFAGLMEKVSETAQPSVVNVVKSITVNRSPEECYRFWHDFENFPRFMKHVESVRSISDKRYHWKAKGPMGLGIVWDAEVIEDQPGQVLAWRSVDSSDVDNAGRVRFEAAPGGRGTLVRVEMQYSPPGGKAGSLIAKLFGEEPSQQINEDLRRFKQLIEAGEIPTTVGQPSGRRDPISRLLFRKGAPG